MNVLENLKIGAAYIKEARDRIEERLDFVLRSFRFLRNALISWREILSGGQQRMLACGPCSDGCS
jgi:branched-chain amino acid transport system ATP-binding protein